jgi:membrane protein
MSPIAHESSIASSLVVAFEANHHTSVGKPDWPTKSHNSAARSWRKAFEIVREILAHWDFGYAIDKAAEVSFYLVLSCFPFLLVVTVLLAWLYKTSGLTTFSHWLTGYMPATARDTVVATIQQLSKGAGRVLSFGLLLTIWSASSGSLSLMDALTDIYGQKEARSYLKRRGIAIVAALVAAVFLLACFGIWRFGHLLGGVVLRDVTTFSTKWTIIRWAVTLAMICLAVDLMNYFLPAKRLPWRWVTPGSILTTFCFVVASALLSLYVNHNANMAKTYGALTGFIVMMLWIYVVIISILLGAQADAAAMSSGQMKS